MRISDWSSDVCSSDLPSGIARGANLHARCRDSAFAGPPSIRLYHQHPLHFSCFFHWACKLSDGAGSLVAENRTRRLCHSLSLLVEDICHCLWHGCRLGPCHVLSVRPALVGLFRLGRPDSRTSYGLRSIDRLLSVGRLSGRHAFLLKPGGQRTALRRNLHLGGGP